VAEQAGARSQLSGVIGAGLVAIMLVFFSSLLADLPQPTLAAVVIAAALSLADIDALVRFGRARRSSLALALVAFGGVVLLGVLQGIVLAIALSILMFFKRNWWPHGELLGRVPGSTQWHSTTMTPAAIAPPGVLVYRWEAPLFFANSGMFRQQVRALVRKEQPRLLVLQCEAITDIDVTAADMLAGLVAELDRQGVQVAYTELRTRLLELLQRYDLVTVLHRERFYPSVDAALAALDGVDEDPNPAE
jgi:MFS superfamily sulfate permease-like transporter